MVCRNPGCLGNYDFDNIAFFARKRFVDGWDTVSLLAQARSQQEKEEIALVCLLDVEDQQIRDLELNCVHAEHCPVSNCRTLLREMIAREIAARQKTGQPRD